MTDEQMEALCGAIRGALYFENASAFEHVFGPSNSDMGVAGALREIASSISSQEGPPLQFELLCKDARTVLRHVFADAFKGDVP